MSVAVSQRLPIQLADFLIAVIPAKAGIQCRSLRFSEPLSG